MQAPKPHSYTSKNPSLQDRTSNPSGSKLGRHKSLTSDSEIAQELSDLIHQYLDASPLRTPAILGRESQVPDSTVRRMMQGEDVPDLATVMALLKVIGSQEERRTFLAKYFPKSHELFEVAFHDPHKQKKDATFFISDDIALNILRICLNRKDTTELAIRRLFGDYGIERLQELIEVDYIVKDASGHLNCTNKAPIRNAANSLEELAMMTRIYNRKNLSSDAAFLFTLSESTTVKGMKKIHEIGVDFLKKTHKLIKEHPGDIPMYMGLMNNTFDSDLYAEQAQQSKAPSSS
ncbi:MAG: hypothetical protein OXC44_08320 [Proteobacteria bacterium]|nr:hypothetical protein [Pseudomonadota bacterium]